MFLAFFAGLVLGGMLGVAMMCLLQISRDYRDDKK